MTFNTKKFPFIEQLDSSDCGVACIRMISKHYNVNIPNNHKAFIESNLTRQGLSFAELVKISTKIGYESLLVELNYDDTVNNVNLPSIFLWEKNHYVIVYKIKNNKVYVCDPELGRLVYSKNDFLKGWSNENSKGMIFLMQPKIEIYENNQVEKKKKIKSLVNVFKYLLSYKKEMYLLAVVLLISSIIEFIFPFFTQKIIDKGINNRSVSVLYLIMTAQTILFLGKISNEFYRSWLFTHVSSRVSFKLVSNFLIKLMNLPIKFFYSKTIGDLLERIDDHKRIENFLTNDLLKSVFAFFSLIVFSVVLLYYNTLVFYIFLGGNILQNIWVFSFLGKIEVLDKKKFHLLGKEQAKNVELLYGMQDIKLNNLEDFKIDEWEKIQFSLFKNRISTLTVSHKYEAYRFISFVTTILITFTSAYSVINGHLTIGAMMVIIFVLGAVNVPISQLINFFLNFRLMTVSVARLDEIDNIPTSANEDKFNTAFEKGDISLRNVTFSYDGITNVLNNIDVDIKEGHTTAIVGLSGSGKTTLIKLLLKFYEPSQGSIKIGNTRLENISEKILRNNCGVVFQDSFIFSNSIAFNITLEEKYDDEKLKIAAHNANIIEFINELPLKFNTLIGQEGIGMSQGQRQRILIARAIYKNPNFLFFDEATNSLDAENEKIIVDNLDKVFIGKTMFIVAHRLSTVMKANQIIVLDKGHIVENGTHEELINLKGKYFKLIKNQLELGD